LSTKIIYDSCKTNSDSLHGNIKHTLMMFGCEVKNCMTLLFTRWCINISYSLVSIWTVVFLFYSVAVMTRAFPDYSGNRQDLVLLQNIACYLLLSCGVVYIFSVRLLNRETIVPIQKLFYYAFFPKSWFVNTTWQTVSPMMILNNSFKTIWFVFLCANYIHVII
jgi:hypothetical protein